MPNATSSRAQLRTALEAAFGDVTAATARRKVRMTGESFSHQMQFEKSKEIRPDRQVSDAILVGISGGGGFNFELSYKEYDMFLESALQSTFLLFNTSGISPTLTTPTFAANSLTQTGGTSFATLEKGQWFQILGCTGGAAVNNGLAQASLTVAATATVITTETTFAFTGAAAGTVVIRTGRLKNGTALRTHLFELEYQDVTQFKTMRGFGINKMSLGLQSRQVVTGTFDCIGKDALPLTGTSNIPGTDDVNFSTAFNVMNASGNVAMLREGGAALPAGVFVKSLSFDFDNALRAQDAVANAACVGLGNGTISLTGKMTVYFSTAALFNKAINNTTSNVTFAVLDGPVATGNGYVVSLPQIEYTSVDLVAGSMDTDMTVDLGFMAVIDVISGKMILVDRFGA